MLLSRFKKILLTLDHIEFQLENGTFVPPHFHITEMGVITKNFIDCGGTLRNEKVVNFQLWDAGDVAHRLEPAKLLKIIQLCEQQLDVENTGIEVEYQSGTIGKYALAYNGSHFLLKNKQTACLAKGSCADSSEKKKVKLSGPEHTCCTPGAAAAKI
jgi:hypothetical protein